MAWVTRIRECKQVDVLIESELGRKGDEGRMPGIIRARRVCVLVPRASIERVVGREYRRLPVNKGAGPCGTLARGPCRSIAWSITHLVEPLAHYYATYVPPQRIGAKIGPRGRRAA